IGVAFAGLTATKAAVQPFGGWIVDRFGARLVGGGALLVSTVAIGLLAFATSGEQVIVLRLLWGIGEGLAMPALYGLVSSLGENTAQGAAKAMGWFGSAAVLGMTVGPGLVAVFSGILTFHRAFLLGGVLTLSSAVLVAVVAKPVEHSSRIEQKPSASRDQPLRPLL